MRTSKDLRERALAWLQSAALGAVVSFKVLTTPSPTHRIIPLGMGRAAHAKPYANYMADCQKAFVQQMAGSAPLAGRLIAVVDTVKARPKKTILSEPLGDADNFAKGPLDAATKAGLWVDDKQLVSVLSLKRWAEPGEEQGVTLHIAEV